MLNLEIKTKLSQQEATEQIKRFFGGGGHGLHLCDETESCLSFEGGGGYVTATVSPEGKGTKIDLVTQEWDFQAQEFASRLPKL